tara:strand:- start:44 stop:262 length:219 start_codon:yes stop_codon:yes gene_type:complete
MVYLKLTVNHFFAKALSNFCAFNATCFCLSDSFQELSAFIHISHISGITVASIHSARLIMRKMNCDTLVEVL